MNRLKLGLSALAVTAALVAVMPISALAAQPASAHATVVFGSVASMGTNSFVVTTASGTATVNTNKNTHMIGLSAAARAAGLVSGDAVWANGNKGRRGMVASTVKFDITPFAIPYSGRNFYGHYSTSAAGSLTIVNRHGKLLTFATNGSTRYREYGKKVASPTYAPKQRITVWARELTDSSRLARRVYIFKNKK